jgi:hypothetical protein
MFRLGGKATFLVSSTKLLEKSSFLQEKAGGVLPVPRRKVF